MSVSKTSVQSVDLDDLERQLREVAVSSLPKRKDDPLSELARIVGRDKSLRSIVGGRAQVDPVHQPVVANDEGPSASRFVEARPATVADDEADYDLGEEVWDDESP